jgi:hypothetical protein
LGGMGLFWVIVLCWGTETNPMKLLGEGISGALIIFLIIAILIVPLVLLIQWQGFFIGICLYTVYILILFLLAGK